MTRRGPEELSEVGRLFRAKLQALREQERPRATAKQRAPVPRRRVDLTAIASPPDDDEVLSSTEVARLVGVHPKTVARWADQGLPSFRTVGGHRRYRWRNVVNWLNRADGATP